MSASVAANESLTTPAEVVKTGTDVTVIVGATPELSVAVTSCESMYEAAVISMAVPAWMTRETECVGQLITGGMSSKTVMVDVQDFEFKPMVSG
jgi:hypothetical protein